MTDICRSKDGIWFFSNSLRRAMRLLQFPPKLRSCQYIRQPSPWCLNHTWQSAPPLRPPPPPGTCRARAAPPPARCEPGRPPAGRGAGAGTPGRTGRAPGRRRRTTGAAAGPLPATPGPGAGVTGAGQGSGAPGALVQVGWGRDFAWGPLEELERRRWRRRKRRGRRRERGRRKGSKGEGRT